MKNKITISEIFGPTIAGEGSFAGQPTVFVRTGGCDFRCSFCDSLHSVLPEHKGEWQDLDADQVFSEVQRLSHGRPLLVSLSGGNPALQPLGDLIHYGRAAHYTFALETQGTVAREWFRLLDYLVLSPKPPSSKMQYNWQKLAACVEAAEDLPHIFLKFVVFTDQDYRFARLVSEQFPALPVYLQTGTRLLDAQEKAFLVETGFADPVAVERDILRSRILSDMDTLAQKTIADGWFAARVCCQQHVLLWGDIRGV